MRGEQVELLAPAGSYEALVAAVNAGADAIYLGGTAFGARQYAQNFDRAELAKAVKYAHLHRVRIFVTVNTLVDDGEMEELKDYLLFLEECGVDGIIVQDLGVVSLAREVVPRLPLHASTQMTVTNAGGVAFARHLGMERTVLCRECSFSDIQAICASTPSEIEVFIHGALCVCYSGQCLMSSLIGGRSGNRGRCAQPCRLPYTLVNKAGENILSGVDAGEYLLSPKDLNTLDILPELLQAGVKSLKIEGRMKRPEYVAVVVDIYRRAIDSYYAGHYAVSDADKRNIEQIFNRDFTTAYLKGRPGRTMMSDRRPNNRGVRVGRVERLKGDVAQVKVERELHLGDDLEFWVSVGGRKGLTLENMKVQGKETQVAPVGSIAELTVPRGVRLHDRVFRTFDSALMRYAQSFYTDSVQHKIPVVAEVVAIEGETLKLILRDNEGNEGVGRTQFRVERARKHPLTLEVVRKQIERLGTTEYVLTDLTYSAQGELMVPMSELNEARRQAVDVLSTVRLRAFPPLRTSFDRHLAQRQTHFIPAQSKLSVVCDTKTKALEALAAGAKRLIMAGEAFSLPLVTLEDLREIRAKCATSKAEFALATARIVRQSQLAAWEKTFAMWRSLAPDAVYIANNGLWQLAQGLPRWADFGLNIYNSRALTTYAELEAEGAVLSPELTLEQVKELSAASSLPLEALVQGPLEMMVSEYCIPGSFLGNLHTGSCSFRCREEVALVDRKGATFPLKQDNYGRMHILNSHDLSLLVQVPLLAAAGLAYLRLDGRSYSAERLKELVSMYEKALRGQVTYTENLPNTTRGHYFRGVL